MPRTERRPAAMRSPSRLLIAQTTYLGDLILTLPLALRIREQFPACTVDMLVRSDLAPIARACPAVNDVHVMDKEGGHPTFAGLRTLARELRDDGYDHVITMPGSIRTALLMVLAGIPHRIGWDPGDHLTPEVRAVRYPGAMRRVRDVRRILAFEALYRWSAPVRKILPPLYTRVLAPRRDAHRAAWALDALHAIGGKPSTIPPAPWLALPQEAHGDADRLLPAITRTWVVIAPGATQPTRRWPEEHMVEFIKLLDRSGHPTVIIGTDQERETGLRVVAEANVEHAHVVAGTSSVLTTCEIIRRAGVVVANDSAPVHIASALGTPVVALFGPTSPSFGFGPLSEQSVVVERSGLACRPCTVYGSATCPIGSHACMRAITPQDVQSAVLSILDRPDGIGHDHGGTR